MQENEVVEPKYGEKIISEFDVEKDLEIWENKHERDYKIKITLPEFCCLCPRSGYPDFATIYLEYVPAKFVVELKAIKLYINSFMTRNISHEDSINEIYEVLERKIAPKWMKITGDFNPRGNVHTVIEICSDEIIKKTQEQSVEAQKFEKFSRDSERSAVRVSEPIEEIQKPAIENLAPVVKINLTINREERAVKKVLKNLNLPVKSALAS